MNNQIVKELKIPYSLNSKNYSITLMAWIMGWDGERKPYVHSYEILNIKDENMNEIDREEVNLVNEDIEAFNDNFIFSILKAYKRGLQ